ncbi:TetR/AcrR family transcriptional regulator [Phytomonospora endophytica]|uniref:AcrR family transcriptional regulator n=1 Tax=Phytomonospora endophytica TaxID=714109 RepID=A0A841FIE8_9ACTN|nr:TetR family transcriptional regulator [Phytomonospora endophytica]MBB6034733.1 AcrR family transcriptional regulator [Phytomonospora endophytica]GIG69063.1 TetR family transcriptional regulator [Phytomonospora endophytica]
MTGRTMRADATRELILDAAERLFAEDGVFAVSNRQVSEAAGQGNNAAVGYHFGTKADLIRAIIRRRSARIEAIRRRMLDALPETPSLRDWLACLVRPATVHLAELGEPPSWYARFGAQVMTDPTLRPIMVEEALTSPALARIVEGLRDTLPDLPDDVRAERGDMARQLMVHTLAERERALAEGTPTPRATWEDAATGLVDALAGMWGAGVSGGRG